MKFRATLHPRGPAAAIVLSDAQVAEIGGGAKTPPVRVTLNGQMFPLRIARMRGESMIGLSRAVRAQAGVEAGDEVDVEVVLDSEPREVTPPPVLAAALASDPTAEAAFDALAFTQRKEFARWVEEAKRDETRDRRVAETLRMLREGRTR